jgi:hypothetical protein
LEEEDEGLDAPPLEPLLEELELEELEEEEPLLDEELRLSASFLDSRP